MEFLRREPALVAALLDVVVALAAAYGFDLSAEQVGVLFAVVAGVLNIGVRQLVTPYVGEVKDVLGDHTL